MLCENLKMLRSKKGLSQEDIAQRLHVVRQTVSKWEKGLSVPDADMLVRLAEELEVPVSTLLGQPLPQTEEGEVQLLAHRLEEINAQLAQRQEKRRKGFRVFWILLFILTLGMLVFGVLNLVQIWQYWSELERQGVSVIGGADGSTAIVLAGPRPAWLIGVMTIAMLALSLVGIHKTKRK